MKKVRIGYGIALALLAIFALTGCPKPTDPVVPVQPNAKLSALDLNGGLYALSPAFSADVVQYTATVPNAVTTVTVNAVREASTATVTINGGTNTSVALNLGDNTITIAVSDTTNGGTANKTYTIVVTRQTLIDRPADANLVALSLNNGTYAFDQVFNQDTLNYTVTVANTVASVIVNATTAADSAVVTINATSDPNVALSIGDNQITVLVTDTTLRGTVTKTYTITVTRLDISDASLSALQVNGGNVALDKPFDSATYSYSANVLYSVASVTIAATKVSSGAALTINGGTETTVNLNVGSNTITIAVTHTTNAGTDNKTYTITITRGSPSTEARLGTLIVKEDGTSTATLSPTFEADTLTYDTNFLATASTATFNVSPINAYYSSVTLNGNDITATLSGSINLTGSTTTATIVVKAEDGNTAKTYTVNINKVIVPLNIQVIESINGTKLGNVSYSITDSQNNTVTGITNSNGSVTVQLAGDKNYTIVTSKNDYATCTAQQVWVGIAGNNNITMVNQKLGMVTKPAGPSEITSLFLSKQTDMSDIAPIDFTDPNLSLDCNGTTYLVFEIYSQNAIEATAWSGFGAKLGIDKMPSVFDGINGYMLSSDKTTLKPGYGYVSYYLFDLTDQQIDPGLHNMTIVAYDVANNRLQSTKSFTLIPPSYAGTAIPGTAAFSALSVDLRAFPLSRGYFGKKNDATTFALNQYLGNDISYRAAVTFKLLDGTNNVAIRGFHIYRSTNGTTWTQVSTVNYGALSTGSSGTHTFFDTDSALEAGTTYYYKIRAFTDAANYKDSDGTARAKLMAPFQANLTAPLNQTSFDYNPASPATTIPNFVFTISNTSLWSSTESDYFYFFLTIKEKSGDWKYIGRFRYRFISTPRFECKVGNTWYALTTSGLGLLATDITYSAGNITIKPAVILNAYCNAATGAAIEFEEGVTYEWDIVGDLAVFGGTSADHPAYFEKAYTGGISKSYADVYSTGANTINGAFEFYVQ